MNKSVGKYAQLSSNDGYNLISLNARRADSERVVFFIAITNYNPVGTVDGDGHETKTPVVSCQLAELAKLGSSMSSWMIDNSSFVFEIRCLDGQFCKFEICIDEDFICSLDKPVFRFTYSELRFAIESRFVVDQSCVRLFLEGLEKL